MNSFSVPDNIILGSGVIADAVAQMAKFGSSAFIVTGPHVANSDAVAQLCAALRANGVGWTLFAGITGEPTVDMISSGVEAFRVSGSQFIIGIGGGSPLDAAKAIAAMAVNEGSIADFCGKEIGGSLPPVVAIPTTAGTGSEATRFTVITDSTTDVKMLLRGEALVPKMAVVDYSVSLSMPEQVAISTGFDALTHAIEAFLSRRANPLTDALAVSAVRRIIGNLQRSVSSVDTDARREMAVAALEAGICINNSSVTVVHGMSRPIGALFHVPHGISNAMLLLPCLRDLLPACRRRMELLADAAIGSPDSDALVDAVAHLAHVCRIPSLQAYGIPAHRFEELLPKMAADAIASGSPANAPKEYSQAQLIDIYRVAFHG